MVVSHRATTEKRSSLSLLRRNSAAASAGALSLPKQGRMSPCPLLVRTYRTHCALHGLRNDHRGPLVEMNTIRPAQFVPVGINAQPSARIGKHGMNDVVGGPSTPRAH